MAQIEGVVEDVIFHNEHNGWSVINVVDGGEEFTCVGTMQNIVAGERLRLTGEWTTHRDYGRQLKVSHYESIRPTTASGIERYLASGIVRGVGPATAKLIVHHFGADTLTILDDDPRRLTEIPGIGPKRAAMISESYFDQRNSRQTMLFLQEHGFSPALSNKIIRTFGENTLTVVRQNPYLLAERIEGVGFKTADEIAMRIGIAPQSAQRIGCAVEYLLEDGANSNGHIYLPLSQLIKNAVALLSVDPSLVQQSIDVLTFQNALVQRTLNDVPIVYQRKLFEAEGEVVQRIAKLIAAAEGKRLPGGKKKIAAYEKTSGLTLHAIQRDAVLRAVTEGISIMTGGPGTGKTTCIQCLMELLQPMGKTVLCAPTGRAAKRMSETSGEAAQTIHRMLEYNGENNTFQRDEHNPIDADALIVDEVSMVDIFLMRALLRALPAGCRLILVGDADQLPSVGAGNVLGDLIESGVVPVTRLTEIFRQGEHSMIVQNAHRINGGQLPIVNQKESDFFLERVQSQTQAAQAVCSLSKVRLPNYLGIDAMHGTQVMTPMKKGDCGVYALNKLLQNALNPPHPDKSELIFGAALFRQGDKVMQVRNNYEMEWSRVDEDGVGVFNGDIGFIRSIDPIDRVIDVLFDDGRTAQYLEADIEDLDLSYCMSVHKSQGSEFDAVILALVSGPPMLFTRNLLYTAVTRAKRFVVIVGREECVEQMVSNNYISKRYTTLAVRLCDLMQS